MILFRPEHVAPILEGRKTQTRRLGKRRWNVGAVHGCYTRPPFARGGSEPFCRVRILDVWQEHLWWAGPAAAHAEGYDSPADFREAFWRINRLPRTSANPLLWVVEFEVVG